MRAVIQRVKKASVIVAGESIANIQIGLLVFLGIEVEDDANDIEWLTNKLIQLRIFGDASGHMNLSLLDIGGEALIVSQFTLHASYKKGNRPSFIKAAKSEIAEALYSKFCEVLTSKLETPIQSGKFGAHMEVHLINDGPVTIFIDTKNKE